MDSVQLAFSSPSFNSIMEAPSSSSVLSSMFNNIGCTSLSFSGLKRLQLPQIFKSNNVLRFPISRVPSIASCKSQAAAGKSNSSFSFSSSSSSNPLSIVLVSSEVAPWSKTGGLGDVLCGLPPALAALGHRVMTVAPRYDQYGDAWDTDVLVDIEVADATETVRFFHSSNNGVDRVFIDHPLFLEKIWGQTGSHLYGPGAGEDFKDNHIRFSLFNQAAIEAPLRLNFLPNGPYGEDVIFVCNDWHSALVPSYLKSYYKSRGIYKNAKVAICIHNIAYQGSFPCEDFSLLNLPDQFKSSLGYMDDGEWKINWLKAGILQSDLVLTVSPNYASELVSGRDRGMGLDFFLRRTGITGIVNGMDVEEWDPSTDKFLEVKYDEKTVVDAKPSLKEDLQAELGLPVNPDVPVFGFIGRLEEQKGSDILVEAMSDILKDDVQVVILGTGKKSFQNQLEKLELKFSDKARGVFKFNAPLGHKIVAGADFMMVPSRFEPCGLVQLYAMRYGTIPLVASTGGLVDTVKDGVTGFQIGRSFNVEYDEVDDSDVEALVTSVRRAMKAYKTPLYYQMIENCMAQDLSWKEPAKKWEQALASLAARKEEESVKSPSYDTEILAVGETVSAIVYCL